MHIEAHGTRLAAVLALSTGRNFPRERQGGMWFALLFSWAILLVAAHDAAIASRKTQPMSKVRDKKKQEHRTQHVAWKATEDKRAGAEPAPATKIHRGGKHAR